MTPAEHYRAAEQCLADIDATVERGYGIGGMSIEQLFDRAQAHIGLAQVAVAAQHVITLAAGTSVEHRGVVDLNDVVRRMQFARAATS